MEAIQLEQDAARIIMFEARLCDVADPLAGSYYVEHLTDELEKAGWEIIKKIDEMGGMVTAIESGWMDREIAKSAWVHQKAIESGKQIVVGVNKFVGEGELEININRMVPDPYDPERRARAEERQIANLNKVRKERDNQAVSAALKRVKEAAQDESANTIPPLVEAVEAYATIGEITTVLKEVFGTYQEPEL
jgi:methylmalonyl-CoA mutase N-terminal domain/subunit